MEEVVIVEAVRTAIGKLGGSLKDVECDHLAAVPIRECIARTQIDPKLIDEVIMGQAKMTTDAANLARVSALRAGVPIEVPAYSIMRQCGSGLEAVNSAARQIMAGYSDVIIAGGVESMSTAPYYLRKARYGYNVGNDLLVDPNTESQPGSQPEEIFGRIESMGLTAENLAEEHNISREEQDIFALKSQNNADKAIVNGYFKEQIVPVEVKKKKEVALFDTDEHPRKVDIDKLKKLSPAFKSDGTVTAGNSSGRNDGASALLVMSATRAKQLGLKPKCRILSQAVSGVDPRIMGIGPVPATNIALERAGLTLKDMDLIELNEAFAAQALACIKLLKIEDMEDKINVCGGAIALGHPLGATGAIVLTKLIYDLTRLNKRYGLATLCIAGGQGITTVVENIFN